MKTYKPTFTSFIGSFLYDISPAMTAAVITYFLSDSIHWTMWIASGLMIILSLYLITQSIFVHFRRLYLDDNFIGVSGPMLKVAIRWQDIISRELRERKNLMSRTDRLLVIKAADHVLLFNTSTLSKKDEDDVLKTVAGKGPLLIKKDKPTI